MATAPDIICIGAAHWDIIGQSPVALGRGDDVPGRIDRRPGGVALNIAAALCRYGLAPALLTAIGRDAEGEALIEECGRLGIMTENVHRPQAGPTDRYLAVEDPSGMIAAIADARTLEGAGAEILRPLEDGRLGSADDPWPGTVVLDGNLSEAVLAGIVASPLFGAADLRLAAVSPAKAVRLRPFLGHRRATVYLNRAEAEALLGARLEDAPAAAEALRARGAVRALVTDGGRLAALAEAGGVIAEGPAAVPVARVTGAGDAVVAAHIAAERRGEQGRQALISALRAAAGHVAEGAA
jgi:sugar/nucleoside kinase (ribokinase family)